MRKPLEPILPIISPNLIHHAGERVIRFGRIASVQLRSATLEEKVWRESPAPIPPLGVEGDSRTDQTHLFDPPQMKRGDRSLLKMSYYYTVPNISIYV